jgi:acetate kinase
MAFTLLINPGSASKKYTIVRDDMVVSTARFEKRDSDFELCIEQNGIQQKCEGITGEQFGAALDQVLATALDTKLIAHLDEITIVGVRVVAPGTYFQKHQMVTDAFIHRLREREPAAPLHIPSTLAELELLQNKLPNAKVIAISDSTFHSTMPAWARNYSIEQHDTHEYDIHRFGYHGISVASILPRMATLFGSVPHKVVVAHIGSGVSMTALVDGVSIDTTMGFSPDSGMIMGSRAGDLDAGAMLELMRVKNFKNLDALSYIQRRGGIKGICGESDIRILLERAAKEDESAKMALAHFVYKFKKQLGSLVAAMSGIDALVLTATASERSAHLRQELLRDLSYAGIVIDTEKNSNLLQTDGVISLEESEVKVAVIRTQELQEMLRITQSF